MPILACFSIDNNKKERFCLGTVFQTGIGIYFFNPETSSRVTLASLGIGFQPKLKTWIIINSTFASNKSPLSPHCRGEVKISMFNIVVLLFSDLVILLKA